MEELRWAAHLLDERRPLLVRPFVEWIYGIESQTLRELVFVALIVGLVTVGGLLHATIGKLTAPKQQDRERPQEHGAEALRGARH